MSPDAFPARETASRLFQLPQDPTLALVFPGQGSQKPGMGDRVRAFSSISVEVFAIADSTLGFAVSNLCAKGPEEALTLTSNAQPAILTTSIAVLATALESGALDRRPAYLLGHSLGEYTALVAAGSLALEDALRMVRRRGELMMEAGKREEGTLAAVVGLDEATVEAICTESGAEVANYNAPTQTVVGGRPDAVERACILAKEQGGRGLPVNVSGAFHTSLMASAADKYAAVVADGSVGDPATPIVGNVDGEPLSTAEDVREDLRLQMRRPVRWYQSLDFLERSGVRTIIEIGPGRILTSQAKRSNPNLEAVSLDEEAAIGAPTNV